MRRSPATAGVADTTGLPASKVYPIPRSGAVGIGKISLLPLKKGVAEPRGTAQSLN